MNGPRFRVRRRSRTLTVIFAAAPLACASALARAQTTASWLNPVNGTWTNPTLWSSDPFYPNNANPPGTTYHAIIGATGTPYTVTMPFISGGISLDALTLSASNATLVARAGTLSAGAVSVGAGTLMLESGTLRDSTLSVAAGGVIAVTMPSYTFSNITLASDLVLSRGLPALSGNLTLGDATLTLAYTSGAGTSSLRLAGAGTHQILGRGDVVLSAGAHSSAEVRLTPDAGAKLVIGPEVTVRTASTSEGGGTASVVIGSQATGARVHNRGTIAFQRPSQPVSVNLIDNEGWIRCTAGTLTLTNLVNTGTVTVENARLFCWGPFTNAGLVRLVNSGAQFGNLRTDQFMTVERVGTGTLVLRDIDNTGQVFDSDRVGTFSLGGLFSGGRLIGTAERTLLGEGTFNGVTIAAPLRAGGYRFQNVTLDGGTIAIPAGGVFTSSVAGTMSGSGDIVLDNPGGVATINLSGAVLDPGVTLRTGGGDGLIIGTTSFTLRGTTIATPGRTLSVGSVSHWTNAGHVTVDGGTFALGTGSWTNAGSVTLVGGTFVIRGAHTPATLGTFNRAGGTVLYAGSFNNAGGTFDLANTPVGPVDLGSAVVTGGTIVSPGRAVNAQDTPSLRGLTLDADVDVHGGLGLNDVTLAGRTVRVVGATAAVGPVGTLGGTGTIRFDGGQLSPSVTSLNLNAPQPIVIGPGIVIETSDDSGGVVGGPVITPVRNEALISARHPGAVIRINTGSGTLTNAGTIEAVNGGVLWLESPIFNNGIIRITDAQLRLGGNVSAGSLSGISLAGAEVVFTGTWNNAGSTLVVRDADRSIGLGSGGLISGGTISAPSGGALRVYNTVPAGTTQLAAATLSNVRVQAPVELQPAAELFARSVVNDSTISMGTGGIAITLTDAWSSAGRITASRGTTALAGTWSNGGAIDVAGGTLSLGGAWANAGSIAVTGGGTLTLVTPPTAHGDLSVTNAYLAVAGTFTTQQLLPVARTNAPVYVRAGGVVLNADAQIDIADPAGNWTLAGGQIRDGSLGSSTGAAFEITGGALVNVRLAADANVRGNLDIGLLTLDDAAVHVIGTTSPQPVTRLVFSGVQTLGGQGTVVFDGPSGSWGGFWQNGGTLTIAPQVHLRTTRANAEFTAFSLFPTTFINQGTVSADGRAMTFYPSIVNEGLMEAVGGGIISHRISGAVPRTFVNDGTVRAPGPGDRLAFEHPITNTGTIDLGGSAVIRYPPGGTPAEAVRAQLVTGHNGGTWDGPGINSSRAAGAPGYAVGYAEARQVLNGFPSPASWNGWTVYEDTLLLLCTRYGDADLDGEVNLQDFNRLASNFGSTGAVWTQGDFNYDGIVNLQDFNRLASNFGLGAAGAEVTPDEWARLGAAVPEPGMLGLFGVAATAAMWRRRRRPDCS
jgi:hypothetical protein